MTKLLRSLVLLLLAAIPGGAEAAMDEDGYRRLNAALIEAHVVPRYAAFEKAAAALDRGAGEFCAKPAVTAVPALRKLYLEASDAWQAIQHVRFGPVEYFSRSSRIAFWPDPRNSVGRALEELLARPDPASLTPAAFADANVAGQGLPALERLLYDEDGQGRIADGDAESGKRCAVMRAIAGNLARMAADIHREWVAGDRPYRKVVAEAGAADSPYRHPREATLDFIKALHLSVELVADHKLARPLGASAQAARPRLAESWRSGRSLENIRIDLVAGEALYGGFSPVVRALDQPLDALLRRAFVQTIAGAKAVESPVEKAVQDTKLRPKLETLQRQAAALKTLIAERLTAALDIPLGFNALDGD
ncbi:MAG: imelysin family protein [Alphaproteobacteria bacterium]